MVWSLQNFTLLCLQILRSASLGSREGQGLLKAKYPPMDHTSPFGAGPHVIHALTQTGRSASLQQTPTVPREIALSAVRSAAHPILRNAADPQKLAASWVTTQQYGDTADAVSYFFVWCCYFHSWQASFASCLA